MKYTALFFFLRLQDGGVSYPDIELEDNQKTHYIRSSTDKDLISSLNVKSLIHNYLIDELLSDSGGLLDSSALAGSELVLLAHSYPTITDAYKFYRLLAQGRAQAELSRILHYKSVSGDKLKHARADKILDCIQNNMTRDGDIDINVLERCYRQEGLKFNLGLDSSLPQTRTGLIENIITVLDINSSKTVDDMNSLLDHLHTFEAHTGIYLNGNRAIKYFRRKRLSLIDKWNKILNGFRASGDLSQSDVKSVKIVEQIQLGENDIRRLLLISNDLRTSIIRSLSTLAAMIETTQAINSVNTILVRYLSIPHIDPYIKSFLKGQINAINNQMDQLNKNAAIRKGMIMAFSETKTLLDININDYLRLQDEVLARKNNEVKFDSAGN